jgi:hypothetical protein
MKPERPVPSTCRGCGNLLGWVYSTNRPKDFPNVPIDWDSLSGPERVALKEGQHVDFRKGMTSHFTTCPKANFFSKKGGKTDAGTRRAGSKGEDSSLPFE